MNHCRAQHGDVFTLLIAGQRMTFVLDPLSFGGVLKNPDLSFGPIASDVMDKAFDLPNMHGTFDVEKSDDAARRYLKTPALTPLSERMGAALTRVLGELEKTRLAGASGEADLYRLVWDLMFAAGTDALFGDGKFCPEAAAAFGDLDRDFPLMVAGMPKMMTRKGAAGLEKLVPLFEDLGPAASQWMRARLAIFRQVEPKKVGRVQTSVLWAVHANSIPAAFWTLAFLLVDPAAAAGIQIEVDEVLSGAGPESGDGAIRIEQLDAMVRLESAVREALRLSSGSLTVRKVVDATSIETRSGYWKVRRGDRVCLAPHLTHHDPGVFEDPERFVVDRFLVRDGQRPQFTKDGERVGFAFMPFGAGKSMCPGRFFAVNEVKLLVATLLRRYTFDAPTEPLPAHDLSRVGLGIFPPKSELSVTWRRRAPPR